MFGAGRYGPKTLEGRRLIAHELTHVVQQQAGSMSGKLIQRAQIPYGQISWADFKAPPPSKPGTRRRVREYLVHSTTPLGLRRHPIRRRREQSARSEAGPSTIFRRGLYSPLIQKHSDGLAPYMDQDRSWALAEYKGDGSVYCDSKVGKANTKIFRECMANETGRASAPFKT